MQRVSMLATRTRPASLRASAPYHAYHPLDTCPAKAPSQCSSTRSPKHPQPAAAASPGPRPTLPRRAICNRPNSLAGKDKPLQAPTREPPDGDPDGWGRAQPLPTPREAREGAGLPFVGFEAAQTAPLEEMSTLLLRNEFLSLCEALTAAVLLLNTYSGGSGSALESAERAIYIITCLSDAYFLGVAKTHFESVQPHDKTGLLRTVAGIQDLNILLSNICFSTILRALVQAMLAGIECPDLVVWLQVAGGAGLLIRFITVQQLLTSIAAPPSAPGSNTPVRTSPLSGPLPFLGPVEPFAHTENSAGPRPLPRCTRRPARHSDVAKLTAGSLPAAHSMLLPHSTGATQPAGRDGNGGRPRHDGGSRPAGAQAATTGAPPTASHSNGRLGGGQRPQAPGPAAAEAAGARSGGDGAVDGRESETGRPKLGFGVGADAETARLLQLPPVRAVAFSTVQKKRLPAAKYSAPFVRTLGISLDDDSSDEEDEEAPVRVRSTVRRPRQIKPEKDIVISREYERVLERNIDQLASGQLAFSVLATSTLLLALARGLPAELMQLSSVQDLEAKLPEVLGLSADLSEQVIMCVALGNARTSFSAVVNDRGCSISFLLEGLCHHRGLGRFLETWGIVQCGVIAAMISQVLVAQAWLQMPAKEVIKIIGELIR